MSKAEGARKKVTIPTLYEMKAKGEPIAWLTAYDYPMARLMDRAGIEMILVGDSAGMTVLGHETTLPVTMDQMVTFTAAVCRATEYAFVIGDMPYMSYQASPEDAVRNAGRFMAECGTDAVKLEGGARVASVVEALTRAGIPTMGHIGLTPQAYTQLGGYRAQGRDAATARRLMDDAEALEEASAFAILLECIPAEVASLIRERCRVPILGLGSGDRVDGQLLIVHDMLGLFEVFTPKFVKRYAEIGSTMEEAFQTYRREVKEKTFPAPEHFYDIPDAELTELRKTLKKSSTS